MRIAASLLVLLLAGCGGGGDGVSISGSVSFKGQPVNDGMIQFVPDQGNFGGRSAGGTIVNGRYTIDSKGGPPPGSYRVEVSSFREIREMTKEETGGAMFGRTPGDLGATQDSMKIRENVVPAEFNTESKLSVNVPQGRSFEYDIRIP